MIKIVGIEFIPRLGNGRPENGTGTFVEAQCHRSKPSKRPQPRKLPSRHVSASADFATVGPELLLRSRTLAFQYSHGWAYLFWRSLRSCSSAVRTLRLLIGLNPKLKLLCSRFNSGNQSR